jgi:hypothetical protein
MIVHSPVKIFFKENIKEDMAKKNSPGRRKVFLKKPRKIFLSS